MTLTTGVLQSCTRMGAVSVTDAEMLQLALECTGDQRALSRWKSMVLYETFKFFVIFCSNISEKLTGNQTNQRAEVVVSLF